MPSARIAAVIRWLEHDTELERAYRQDVADSFADALAALDPMFDRARFLSACGVL